MDNNKPVTELPVKAPFDFAKWWDRVGILIVLLVLLILQIIWDLRVFAQIYAFPIRSEALNDDRGLVGQLAIADD